MSNQQEMTHGAWVDNMDVVPRKRRLTFLCGGLLLSSVKNESGPLSVYNQYHWRFLAAKIEGCPWQLMMDHLQQEI